MPKRSSHHPAQPLRRAHMRDGYDISLKAYTNGFTTRVPAEFGPRHSMRGFEDTYQNIVDHIVRITYRIWDDRDPRWPSV